MPDVTIVDEREIRSLDPANLSGVDTLITYTPGNGRIATVTIAGKDPSDAQVKAAIEADVARAAKGSARNLSS